MVLAIRLRETSPVLVEWLCGYYELLLDPANILHQSNDQYIVLTSSVRISQQTKKLKFLLFGKYNFDQISTDVKTNTKDILYILMSI